MKTGIDKYRAWYLTALTGEVRKIPTFALFLISNIPFQPHERSLFRDGDLLTLTRHPFSITQTEYDRLVKPRKPAAASAVPPIETLPPPARPPPGTTSITPQPRAATPMGKMTTGPWPSKARPPPAHDPPRAPSIVALTSSPTHATPPPSRSASPPKLKAKDKGKKRAVSPSASYSFLISLLGCLFFFS